MGTDLFEKEQQIYNAAMNRIEEVRGGAPLDLEEYATITDEYGRLLKQFRGITYISDRVSSDLHKSNLEMMGDLELALLEAQNANRIKSEFLSRMSHEMRTPMNAIIGMLQILMMPQDQAGRVKCANTIDAAAHHLLRIIDDVLNFNEMGNNTFKLDYSAFSFESMVRDVSKIIEIYTEEKKQVFSIYLDPSIPKTIIGDKSNLAHVIHSLLLNASKFTPEKGLVKFKAVLHREEKGTLTFQVEVSDTGIGISKEDQAKVFEIFEQADGGLNRKYGGVGLGLPISKQIIEMMGGQIWLESELGKGTKFIFTFTAEKKALSHGNY
jgi:signal transduction histidine kinase